MKKFNPKAFFAAVSSRIEALWSSFNNLSAREKKIFSVAIVLLLAVIMYWGVFMPIREHIHAFRQKIAVQEQQIKRNIRSVREKPKLEDGYRALRTKLDMAKATDDEVWDSMLKDINQYANANHLALPEVKRKISTEDSYFKKFNVGLQVEGKLSDLLNFLADLVRTRRLYLVDSMRVIPSQDDVNKIKANVNLVRATLKNS